MKSTSAISLMLFLISAFQSSAFATETMRANIIGHYGSGFRIDKSATKVKIDTYLEASDTQHASLDLSLDSKCLNLYKSVKASLKNLESEMLRENLFTSEVHSRFEGTRSDNQKYICVFEIESQDAKIIFNKVKTTTFQRKEYSSLDESDSRTIQLIDKLILDPTILNYFHAKHTYFPLKSFVEYIKISETK